MKRLTGILAVIITAAVLMPCLGNIPVMAAGGVAINSTNFPDANFRSVISGRDYDQNGNGYLDNNEISKTLNIRCEGKNISSLKGIEFFTSLQGLWCKENNISSLDVSKNTDLRGIWCSDNALTSLDLSKNTKLVWVYCYNCKITSLDFSKNPDMAYIECNSNPLKSLNVSSNSELEHLMCGDCGLTSLNLSGNPKLTHLDAFNNKLTKLDVSKNTKLIRLNIWSNKNLGSINISNIKGLQYYNCAYNDATSVNVSNNTHLRKLICSYNDISSLNLSNNPELVYLDCACNDISSLDLSKNPCLFFLQAFTNKFTTLNIGNNSRLIKTYKDGFKKSEYKVCKGHSWSINYGEDLLYFLCFDDSVTLSTKYTNPSYIPDSYVDSNDGLSSSDDLVTREMVMDALYDLAGRPHVTGSSRFTDVEYGSWYADAVTWGESNNIAMGYPFICSETFGVGQTVTREDLTFMLYRFSEAVGYYSAFDYGRTDDFKDFFEIDYYAWNAVTWGVQWEILIPKGSSGAPNSQRNICPHGRVTRKEFMSMINSMMDLNGLSHVKTPKTDNGWYKEFGGGWKYYVKGTNLASAWHQSGSSWYYFNSNGFMVTGWKYISGSWHFFNASGIMQTGWLRAGSDWYYLEPSGAMFTGWRLSGGKWYYFDSSGPMVTGWNLIDGDWYCFDSSGAMLTGWNQINGKWYYLNASGRMFTGWKEAGGKWYYLGNSGSMVTGWLDYNGNWYYLDTGGEMIAGTSKKINGRTYNFDTSGRCLNP